MIFKIGEKVKYPSTKEGVPRQYRPDEFRIGTVVYVGIDNDVGSYLVMMDGKSDHGWKYKGYVSLQFMYENKLDIDRRYWWFYNIALAPLKKKCSKCK